MEFLTHEYALIFYGVLLWQVQQHFTHKIYLKTRLNYIGRSMIWGGLLVAFDDEIIEYIEHITSFSIIAEWYYYIGLGFFIDLIRQKITKQ